MRVSTGIWVQVLGDHIMQNWIATSLRFYHDWFACVKTKVISEPFMAGQKWKILYGDRLNYRFLEMETHTEATREFRAAVNLASTDPGFFPADVILISSEQVGGISDLASYADVIRTASISQSAMVRT